jgi:hypothetical protein
MPTQGGSASSRLRDGGIFTKRTVEAEQELARANSLSSSEEESSEEESSPSTPKRRRSKRQRRSQWIKI